MESKTEDKVVFKLFRIADTREFGVNRVLIKLAHETHVSYFIGNFRENYFMLHYLEETPSLP